MYRAKAEIVNGLRVFANGKWLTCMGNKNVQAGDLIWTDGQCVYGFNKISQQPLSITNSQDADWCIPIVIDNVAYIFKSNLREIGKFGSYHISNNRADKIYKCYTGSRKDSNVLGSGTIAFNVSGNNIYALHLADSENSGKGWKHFDLLVMKNNEVVKKIPNIRDPEIAFIENETQWYVLYNSENTIDIDNSYEVEIGYDPFYYHIYDSTPGIILNEYMTATYYKVHNEWRKTKELVWLTDSEAIPIKVTAEGLPFDQLKTVFGGWVILPVSKRVTYEPLHVPPPVYTHSNRLSKLRVPMHNGFYYIINSTTSRDYNFPAQYNVSIYDSAHNLILTADFIFPSYITAYDLGGGKFLIGVEYQPRTAIPKEEENCLLCGLYIVDNSKLLCLKNGYVKNQKIEKMKYSNNWIDCCNLYVAPV